MNHFIKNSVKLSLAPLVTQLISLLLIPIISRLYSQEVFGKFNLITSQISIFAVFATFSIDQAIPLARNKNESKTLFWIGIIITILVSLFSSSMFFVFSDYSYSSKMISLFLLISLMLHGTHMSLQGLSFRHNNFGNIALSRVFSAVGSKVTNVIFALIYLPNVLGLLIGNLMSSFFAIILLIKYKSNYFISFYYFKKNWHIHLKKYYQYPIFSVTSDLIFRFRQFILLFLIQFFFTIKSSGEYSMAITLLAIPLTLISSPFNEVFYRKIAEIEEKSELFKIYKRIVFFFFIIFIGIYLFISMIMPSSISFLLGNKWNDTGIVISIISFVYIFETILPLTFSILRKIGRQNYILFYQFTITILISISIYVGKLYNSYLLSIILVSISSILSGSFLIIKSFNLLYHLNLFTINSNNMKYIYFLIINLMLYFILFYIIFNNTNIYYGIILPIIFVFIYYSSALYFLSLFKNEFKSITESYLKNK